MGFCLPQIGIGNGNTDLSELRVLLRIRQGATLLTQVITHFLLPLLIGISDGNC